MSTTMRIALAVTLAFAVIAPATPARAQERPWADGVTPENQTKALEIFREGNTMLKESLFVRAAEKYVEALKYWDHPAIHYNLALALLNLDKPVEVYEHLIAATKFGAAPLDTDKFENAGRFKTLIEQQLARVDIVCMVEGARVVLDGQEIFQGPGHWKNVVRAGPHTIVASAEGFVSTTLNPTLPANQDTTVDVKLFTAEALTKYKRKWAAWKPWAATAGGAAVVLAGGLLHWQARSKYQGYDDDINACGGCVPSPATTSKLNSGDTYQALAITSYAVGGAALATGAVLVYVNRARPYRMLPGQDKVAVTPIVGPGGGGFVATLHF